MSDPLYVPPPAPVPGSVTPQQVLAPTASAPMPAYGAYASPYGVPPAVGFRGPWGAAPLRAPLGLGVATIVLAAVWTALQFVSLATSFDAADQYAAAAAAGTSVFKVNTAYDGLGLLTGPVTVAAYVVGCLWLQDSRRFAEVVAPAVRQTRGRVWVWLGWVVPVVSFWFPYQVVRDVAAGTGARVRSTLGWWWASWLVAQWLAGQASFLAAGWGSRDPSTLPTFEMCATAATVGGFILWVRIVRAVSAGQRARLATIG
ncbi:DUF4328 domain-containing protein [Xylanimonas sp. McL0601]|uniref:DUF4328 domain-containing protein n=1 Tax=Xylanimonas sp. McL0601 TaxID=3414739 RepID=UPI003CFB04A6